jgi:hypothetical protein
MRRIPRKRIQDVVFLDFQDEEFVACLNPLSVLPNEDKGRLADEMTTAFLSVLESTGKGPRMENILRQACYALMHVPGATLADIGRLLDLTNDGARFRAKLAQFLTNPDALRFWQHTFPGYRADALDPVTNKLSKLMLNSKIASVFSQREGRIRWRAIMDNNRIFLARLSGLGPSNTNFVGSLIIGGIKEAACSRSDIPPQDRRPFSLYIDEFHRFTTTSIEDLLVESRKFGVSIRLAHQETGQIDYPTRRAVGTADTVIAFCVDVEDAKHMIKELRKEISEEDMLRLKVGEAFARINNQVVDLRTPPPPAEPSDNVLPEIIAESRRRYYVKRARVSDQEAEDALPLRNSPRVFETFRSLTRQEG